MLELDILYSTGITDITNKAVDLPAPDNVQLREANKYYTEANQSFKDYAQLLMDYIDSGDNMTDKTYVLKTRIDVECRLILIIL